MAVFEIFAREKREMSNVELAKLLGIAETSSGDLLHTLMRCGYLTRTVGTRRYYPTARLLVVAQEVARIDPLFNVANEAVQLLSNQTGETCLCSHIHNDAVQILAQREARHSLRYTVAVGDRIAVHASAQGKALLAALQDEEVREILGRKPLTPLTGQTITSMDRFLEEVAAIRTQGWAASSGEGSDDVSSFAVAGRVGNSVIAVAVSGPSSRIERNQDSLVAALLALKSEIFPGQS